MSNSVKIAKRKNANILLERTYNTCLSDGFAPFEESNPYAENSAVLECARRSQVKRDIIAGYLRQGVIVEDTDNYNDKDPHGVFMRTLRRAGVELTAPEDGAHKELSGPVDVSSLSEEELRARFAAAQQELTKNRRDFHKQEQALWREKAEKRRLGRTVKTLEEQVRATDEIYREIAGQYAKHSTPLKFPAIVSGKNDQFLMPSVLLSDLHFTEQTTAEETMGLNTFNTDIAVKRLQQCAEGAIRILDDHAAPTTRYQGIIVNLGGDIISGDIHDELRQTNRTRTVQDRFGQSLTYAASSFDAAFEAVEALIPFIDAVAERVGVAVVNSVVGNHGRNGEKFTYKGHVHNSFDYLVGKLIEKHYAKTERVRVNVAESTDLIYDVYTSRFLLTHGDRMGVKGGDGFIGSIGPIMRGNKKVRDHLANYGIMYHYTLMGHWHQYQAHSNLVVNGSLCGPNGYSTDGRFNPEPPQQALFMVHPTRGILYHHPVVCDYKYRQPRLDPLIPPPPAKPNYASPFVPRMGHQGPQVVDLNASRPKAKPPRRGNAQEIKAA